MFHLCHSPFTPQDSQLLSFILASTLSVIYFKMSSLKCLATWGYKPSKSATDTVGRLCMASAGIKTKQSGGKRHGYSNNLLVLTHISLQITATSICLKNGFLGLANLSIKQVGLPWSQDLPPSAWIIITAQAAFCTLTISK